jgi:serine/threonine-protein kinase ATR
LLDLAPPQALALQASLAKVLVQALSSHSPASFRAQLSSQAPAVINTAFEVVAQTSVSMAAKLPIVHGLLQCAPAQAAKAVDALLDLFLNRLQRPIPIEAPDSDLLACTVQLKMLPRHVAGPAIAQRMSGPLKDLIGQSIGSNAGQTGGSTTLQSAILNLLLLPLSETFVLSMLPSEQQQHVKAVFATEVEATCPPSHSKKRKRDSIQLPTQAVSRIASHWKGLVQTAIEGTGVEDWATNESLESLVNRLADRLLSRADQPGQQQIVSALLRIPCARNETLKASSREDQAVACTWCDLDQPSMSRVMNDACLKTLLAICPKMLAPSRSMLMHASAFRLLTRFINHVRPGVEAIKLLPPPSVNHIMELIMPHLGSRDRSVRLASGACLVALACAHHSAPIWKDCHMDPALKRLETYANPDHGNKPPLRETALLTLAKLGRYVPDPERFVVLRALTMQLGRQSEPLAAVAYLQVLALARALSTTASRLYAPSMPALLAHIYERHSYGQRSNIIVSALSDLTGIEPSVFIKQNVPHILPAFLLQQRQDALQYLEATAGANVRELCIEHAGPVLASLYLRNPHQTRQGVAWMTDLIGSGIRDIYLTCGQKLLFDLVVELGEESEPRRLVAIDAIKRLDRDVHAGTVVYTVDVQRLLGEHMLAILSQMNEALNDTFVKQNLHYKAKVLRSLALVITEVGTSLSRVTPQVMATLQSSLNMPGLELATLEAWEAFVRSMNFADLAPFIGQTSAAFASMWTHFHEAERTLARKILEFLIVDNVREMGAHVNEMANLSSLHGLQNIQARVNTEHKEASIETRLRYMLTRVGSENQSVCLQGLKDLKTVIETDYTESIAKFVKGNLFDPIIGRTVKTVIGAAHRAGDAWDNVRDTAFEVLGLLGAVDPDRCEMPPADSGFVLHRNFEEPHETIDFVVHLISSILASSYQASNDTRHQSTLAFAIQELLKFCGFTKDVLDKRNQALPTKIRTKWALFSDSVVDIVAPLLDSRYAAQSGLPARAPSRPLYKTVSSFRDWIKAWTLDLIAHVENSQAKKIFDTFVSIIRLGDLAVARRVLPHVALHLVISSKPHKHATTAADNIRHEIISVLSDQVDSRSAYSANARLLCAQVVFDVMDHLSKWTRTRGSEIARKKLQLKKLGKVQPAEMAALTKPMTMVQATLSNVPQHLQAQAALKCKALARSLMNFEMLLTSLSDKSPDSRVEYYDAMHQIYAELDEPDGMEGISVKILHPSLRHQIREHEVLGKWTAAQSCWELQLQQEPRNVASHIGLLTCLRNLGHYG